METKNQKFIFKGKKNIVIVITLPLISFMLGANMCHILPPITKNILKNFQRHWENPLEIQDRVVVKNAVASDGSPGVALRPIPGTGLREKGWALNYATGIIINGPEYKEGYRWWKVQWDVEQDENKMQWYPEHPCNHPPCEAWIADKIGSVIVLIQKK